MSLGQLGQDGTVLEAVGEQLVPQALQHVELLGLGPVPVAQAGNVRTVDPRA